MTGRDEALGELSEKVAALAERAESLKIEGLEWQDFAETRDREVVYLRNLVTTLVALGDEMKHALEHIQTCAGDCVDCRRLAAGALEHINFEAHSGLFMLVPTTCAECDRDLSLSCPVHGEMPT